MLFSEFQSAIGCKDNEHNHKVYRDLEIMYMNSDLTKEQIYEYGRKLVDNSKTEQQIRIENQIKKEIESCKENIGYWKNDIERYEMYLTMAGNTIEDEKHYRRCIKNDKEEIKHLRNKIKALKWILN